MCRSSTSVVLYLSGYLIRTCILFKLLITVFRREKATRGELTRLGNVSDIIQLRVQGLIVGLVSQKTLFEEL